MPRLNKKTKPFVELLYWFVVFFLLGFSFSFHNRHLIDYEHMTMGKRISLNVGSGISGAFFIWLFGLLLKEITAKLFGE